MKIDKKVISYYYSFFEVSKELNQKQFYEFNMAIYKVMFFEEHIDNITFKDAMLTILWKSVKHSIQASVKGFCDKKSIPYDDVFAPLSNPLDNPLTINENVKDNEKEKDNIQVVTPFTFSLKKDTHFQSLSAEYIQELQIYISTQQGMSFEEFKDGCLSKNSYKYKNFKLVFNKWNKNYEPPKRTEAQINAALNTNIFDAIDEMDAQNEGGMIT